MPVSVAITLEKDSPVVDIQVDFMNICSDHRFRALFPVGIETNKIISDGHFYINERPVDKPSGDNWFQPSTPTYPQQDFSLLQDTRCGVAVLNRGLPEIEPMKMGEGKRGLALTLLRCVGWLSRDDFPTRKFMNAGPTISTPDAQCVGVQRFKYAVVPYNGNYIEADIKQLSQKWRTPLPVIQGIEDLSTDGGFSLIEKSSNKTCISAIKKHDDRDTLLVRLYNLTGKDIVETLKYGRNIKAAWIVNLLEERVNSIGIENENRIQIQLAGYQIITIEVEFNK